VIFGGVGILITWRYISPSLSLAGGERGSNELVHAGSSISAALRDYLDCTLSSLLPTFRAFFRLHHMFGYPKIMVILFKFLYCIPMGFTLPLPRYVRREQVV